MSRWSTALVTLLLVALAPSAPAQSGGDGPLLTDAEGDHQVSTDTGTPVPVPRWAALDLLEATFEERPDLFHASLTVADLDPPGENILLVDTVRYALAFHYGGVDYRVTAYASGAAPIQDGVFFSAWLERHDPGSDRWGYVEELANTADTQSDTWSFEIPRGLVQDEGGAPPRPGNDVTGFHATSELIVGTLRFFGGDLGEPSEVPVDGGDRMPDEGVSDRVVPIQRGVAQSGHARLHSDAPVRVSNGEATTLLYEVQATNTLDRPDTFLFTAGTLPKDWTLTFPVERPRIDGGATETVPVLITIPFVHDHGRFEEVRVEMTSTSDAGAVGRLDLGVRFTPVPQPAGHHDTLHLHSQGSDGYAEGYMNTQEEHEGDTGAPVRPRAYCSCGGEYITRFFFDLLPGLQMGIDVDLTRTGTIEVPVQSDAPMTGVVVRGEVSVLPQGEHPGFFAPDNQYAVLRFTSAEPVDLEAGEPHRFTATVEPLPYGDYLPFQADTRMTLHLDVVSSGGSMPICCFNVAEPAVLPGGWMQLPLDEYHDDVDDYFAALSGVDLLAERQHILINPGETGVFNLTLQSTGLGGAYHLELTGKNAEWATVLGDHRVRLDAGGTRPLAVSVTIPADARDGEQADLTLHVSAADNPSVRTLVRLLAEVDTDTDHPDQGETAHQLQASLKDKGSPGPGLPLLLLALAAVALAVRRRG